MNKVKQKASLQKRVIKPLKVFAWIDNLAVQPPLARALSLIEGDGALGIKNGQIRQRPAIAEGWFVESQPVINRPACFPPALVFRRSAQPVIPGNHAAGRNLRHPQSSLGRRLAYMSPERLAVAIGANHIGDGPPSHH